MSGRVTFGSVMLVAVLVSPAAASQDDEPNPQAQLQVLAAEIAQAILEAGGPAGGPTDRIDEIIEESGLLESGLVCLGAGRKVITPDETINQPAIIIADFQNDDQVTILALPFFVSSSEQGYRTISMQYALTSDSCRADDEARQFNFPWAELYSETEPGFLDPSRHGETDPAVWHHWMFSQ